MVSSLNTFFKAEYAFLCFGFKAPSKIFCLSLEISFITFVSILAVCEVESERPTPEAASFQT